MSKRKSATRPFDIVRAYIPPAVCLALWLGVCAVAWISLSNLGAKRPMRARVVQTSLSKGENGDPDMSGQLGSETQVSSSADAKTTNPPDAILSVSRPRPTAGSATNKTATAAASKTDDRPQTKPDNRTTARHEEPSPSTTVDQKLSDTKPSQLTAPKHIARAQLTSDIENKEPVDKVSGVFHSGNKRLQRLYFFTEIIGLRGETVTHSWWHDGRVIAKVTSQIGSSSWRMYSGKKLLPNMIGPWRVVVTDSHGETLSTARFVYKVP